MIGSLVSIETGGCVRGRAHYHAFSLSPLPPILFSLPLSFTISLLLTYPTPVPSLGIFLSTGINALFSVVSFKTHSLMRSGASR